jgi:hypothetical protein
MQGRLNHLESLVIGMMNNQPSRNVSSPSNSVPFSSSGISRVQESLLVSGEESSNHSRASHPESNGVQSSLGMETASGQVVLGMNETAYVGATHWAAILEDVIQFRFYITLACLFTLTGLTKLLLQIEEVKGYFNEAPDEDFDPGTEGQTAAMALGNATPAGRADLLAALPERSVVDRLVSRYFNSNDPAMSRIPAVFNTESILILYSHHSQANFSERSRYWIIPLHGGICQRYSYKQHVKWHWDSELSLLIRSELKLRKAFQYLFKLRHRHIALAMQFFTFSFSLLSLLTYYKVPGVLG